MIRRYGIDTSILVRLLTKDPRPEYERCIAKLASLVNERSYELFASNQVIGEAYIAVQHHYDVSGDDARSALLVLLQNSGLVRPLNGRAVIRALMATGRPGLFDRLIANGYDRADLEVFTLDRKMATLPNARKL